MSESGARGSYVYLLWHGHDGNGYDEAILLGVYSSEEQAKDRLEKAKRLPGFSDTPNDFLIDRYEVDHDEWTEGYVSG